MSELDQELKSIYVEAAQDIYDCWEQDEDGMSDDLGTGGICSLIADAAIGLFLQEGYDAWPVGDDEHAWVAVQVGDTVLEIDIPPHIYEEGAGYNWTKLPGVIFEECHVNLWESELSYESNQTW